MLSIVHRDVAVVYFGKTGPSWTFMVNLFGESSHGKIFYYSRNVVFSYLKMAPAFFGTT